MIIRQATAEDIIPLTKLFALYRQFYGEAFETARAQRFLEERIASSESVIFIAIDKGETVGFTQLFPSYSSVSIQKLWILNDLYVDERHRRKGVAKNLINYVFQYCHNTHRGKLILSTEHGNYQAQRLYEMIGFHRTGFINYEKSIF